jgi:hypothetical protein
MSKDKNNDSEKWERVTSRYTGGDAAFIGFGTETHVVRNTETGETKEVYCSRDKIGENIAKGNFLNDD